METNGINKEKQLVEVLENEREIMSLQEYRRIVQSNEITDLPAKRMNANEINIFACLCYKLQNKKTNVIELTFAEIRELIDYKQTDNGRLVDDIENMNAKLIELKIKQKSDKRTIQFVFFPTFMIDRECQVLTVAVNPIFAYMLNELKNNFTIMDLTKLVLLRSTYSKNLYKKLCKFRNTGVYETYVNDFREYMDIPDSYTISKIDSVVLKVALRELQNCFENLQCEKKYKKNGKGRPSVVGYKFTFTPKSNHIQKKIVREAECEVKDEIKYVLAVKDKFLKNQNETITFSGKKLKVEDIKNKIMGLNAKQLEYIAHLYSEADIQKNPDAYIISLMYNFENEEFIFWERENEAVERRKNTLDRKSYYKELREKNNRQQIKRKNEVYLICPEIEDLENRKNKLRAEAVKYILQDRAEGEKLKIEADEINAKIKSILKKNDFSENYLEPIYRCSKCKDTGELDNGVRCDCYEKIEHIK